MYEILIKTVNLVGYWKIYFKKDTIKVVRSKLELPIDKK